MGMNETPRADRIHIALFGKRNAGKSSLINALTGQQLAIVSEYRGTTTDPVYKSMELLPLGPVVMIDTPGLDDRGELGKLRIKKTMEVLNKTDLVVFVVSAENYVEQISQGLTDHFGQEIQGKAQIETTAQEFADSVIKDCQHQDREFFQLVKERNLPVVIVLNKWDLCQRKDLSQEIYQKMDGFLAVSSKTGENIHALKELLGSMAPEEHPPAPIASDLVSAGDHVILVIPIDSAAPKGRLILPQQQTIRELLEAGILVTCVRETELAEALRAGQKPPALVITDSQAFGRVSKETPDTVRLTSFSILFARHKGELLPLVRGAAKIKRLRDGDRVLISEGCTHHRQCDDIGSVKIPRWLQEFTGKKLEFAFTSGMEFCEDIENYALIIHCGGCMLNARQMKYRIRKAEQAGVSIVNYGVLIAYVHGILERSLAPFPEVLAVLQ